MKANGGFEEVICVRAPKGTSKRIGLLRRRAGVARAVLLRRLLESAIAGYERTPPNVVRKSFEARR